jgi:hypothetical protein
MNFCMSPCIVSASRRTDIPAFFGKEFLRQLNAGHKTIMNPFGGRTYRVDLRPESVACFVFWSKNFRPFFPVLDCLDQRGDSLYFLFTITGLAHGKTRPMEPGVPELARAIETLKELSQRYSPGQIGWRFDPVVFSRQTPTSFWLDTFEELAEELHDHVHRCIFSFCDFYRKVTRRFENGELSDWRFREGSDAEKQKVAQGLSKIGGRLNLGIETCCEDNWSYGTISRGSCVDAPYLARIFPDINIPQRRRPTRKECRCWESRDIGTYGTCRAGCSYCYAV